MCLWRREAGRRYVRQFPGYPTEGEALAAAKELWRQGYAVRIDRGRWRWRVWRSV